MSGIDEFCGCLGVFLSCCCIGCNEASGLWCFYKSCSCRSRRRMDDADFERTVQEFYSSNKLAEEHGHADADAGGHVLELLPQRANSGPTKDAEASDTTRVSTQPAPRRLMDVPRRSADGEREDPRGRESAERVPGEPRSERRERTREWVHAHSVSDPGAEDNGLTPSPRAASRSRSRSRRSGTENQRSKSHGDASGNARARTPGGSVREREAQAVGHTQRPSDAQEYVRAVERSWRRSEDGEREHGSGNGIGVVRSLEGGEEQSTSPPRLEIPMSLRPGRPQSYASTAHPMPRVTGDAPGLTFVGAQPS
ncbi:hypothetical protein BD414DRAFT_486055 [Trametes punicea]|nr:hypothetical protein BD414DRAFT_486055 [Trametes punicea]